MLFRSIYAYTEGDNLGNPLAQTSYNYGDSQNWGDLLVSIAEYGLNANNVLELQSLTDISYDTIGNPITWRDGMTLSWVRGRSLATITSPAINAAYSYNDNGIRTKKVVGATTTTFTLAGSKILRQVAGNTTLDFYYDEVGNAIGFKYSGADYWYIRNGQGDIIGILDSASTQVVAYSYDAWGNPTGITGTASATVGAQNPFRYRGYYYDAETGFYYLTSRYYDPKVGRFINADGAISSKQGIIGHNLFAYCNNNPVNCADSSGRDAIWLRQSDGVPVVGHAALAIQDENGQWWLVSFQGTDGMADLGGNQIPVSTFIGVVVVPLNDVQFDSSNRFIASADYDYQGRVGNVSSYTSGNVSVYDIQVYFEGDFSATFALAKKAKSSPPMYNFPYNNCATFGLKALQKSMPEYTSKQIEEYLTEPYIMLAGDPANPILIYVKKATVPNNVSTPAAKFAGSMKRHKP